MYGMRLFPVGCIFMETSIKRVCKYEISRSAAPVLQVALLHRSLAVSGAKKKKTQKPQRRREPLAEVQ